MEIVSNVALITINETLIVQLVSFLIFMVVINRVMIRPLRSVMRQREDYFKQIEMDIATSQQTLERALQRWQEEERRTRQEAFRLKERLESDGSARAAEIFAAAAGRIDANRQQAEAGLAGQIAEARKSLQAEARELAKEIMQKVLERRLLR